MFGNAVFQVNSEVFTKTNIDNSQIIKAGVIHKTASDCSLIYTLTDSTTVTARDFHKTYKLLCILSA